MSKTRAQPDRARRPGRRLRRRRLPLPLPARPALRSRRRLPLRGDGRALQRRPRQQLRQPRQPGAQHGGELLRRRRCPTRAPTARCVEAAADRVRRADRAARASSTTRGGFGAVWDLIRDDQRVHRGPAAVGAQQGRRRRRGRGGARRLPRGAAHRRAARVAGDPARAPRELWRRLGLAGTPEDQRLPDAAGVGRPARRARRWRRASRCSPGSTPDRDRGDAIDAGSTATATCSWDGRGGRPRRHGRREARAAGVEWLVCVGTDLGSRRGGRSTLADAPPRRVGDRRPAPPRRLPARRASGTRWSRWPRPRRRRGRDRRGRLRLPLRALAARRRRRPRSAPRSRLAHDARPRAGDPHARRVGRHVPRPRRRGRAASARCSTASPAVPTRRARALDLGAYLSFSGIVTFKNADDVRAAAALAPARPPAGRDRRARTSRRCRTAASPTGPRGWWRSARPSPPPPVARSRRWRRPPAATRREVFGPPPTRPATIAGPAGRIVAASGWVDYRERFRLRSGWKRY